MIIVIDMNTKNIAVCLVFMIQLEDCQVDVIVATNMFSVDFSCSYNIIQGTMLNRGMCCRQNFENFNGYAANYMASSYSSHREG
jgi:hypothetical protein